MPPGRPKGATEWRFRSSEVAVNVNVGARLSACKDACKRVLVDVSIQLGNRARFETPAYLLKR